MNSWRRKKNKYGNIKTELDGIIFHSKGEAARYAELKLLEAAGEIIFLKRQVVFDLQVRGKVVCKYIADFVYNEVHEAGTLVQPPVVEDFKGKITDIFRLKAKLFEAVYGYKIKVTKRSK